MFLAPAGFVCLFGENMRTKRTNTELLSDRRKWIRGSFVVKDGSIPPISACYAFFSGNRCLYAGKTKNLRNRMRQHQWKFGYISGKSIPADISRDSIIIRAVEVEPFMHDIYEPLLISLLRPEMNWVYNSFAAGRHS